MIYQVLRQRHMKEAIHLEDQLQREKAAKLAAARAEVAAKRAQDRETLLNAFELVCVMVGYGGCGGTWWWLVSVQPSDFRISSGLRNVNNDVSETV